MCHVMLCVTSSQHACHVPCLQIIESTITRPACGPHLLLHQLECITTLMTERFTHLKVTPVLLGKKKLGPAEKFVGLSLQAQSPQGMQPNGSSLKAAAQENQTASKSSLEDEHASAIPQQKDDHVLQEDALVAATAASARQLSELLSKVAALESEKAVLCSALSAAQGCKHNMQSEAEANERLSKGGAKLNQSLSASQMAQV